MKRAVIFGTTDFAQVALPYLRDDAGYSVEAFTVNAEYAGEQREIQGVPVVPFEDLPRTHSPQEFAVFLGIGYSKVNANRRAVFEACKAQGYTMPTYVHSSVARWKETRIGEGCFIFENNVIQPYVTVGDNCVFWSGNHVGHHTRIGSNVFLASHIVISGRCIIGDNTFVGVNATFRDGITVAPGCVVGAGAIVLKDTVPDGVYKAENTPAHERRSGELRRI